jgi:hypothetical protein
MPAGRVPNSSGADQQHDQSDAEVEQRRTQHDQRQQSASGKTIFFTYAGWLTMTPGARVRHSENSPCTSMPQNRLMPNAVRSAAGGAARAAARIEHQAEHEQVDGQHQDRLSSRSRPARRTEPL